MLGGFAALGSSASLPGDLAVPQSQGYPVAEVPYSVPHLASPGHIRAPEEEGGALSKLADR